MDFGRIPAAVGEVLVAPEGEFPGWAADRLAHVIRELASTTAGSVALALAGGNTPRPVYEALTEVDVPWSRLEIFFGDERAVSPEDSASNYRMARETLLDRVPIAAARVHRMRGEAEPLAAAVGDYASVLPDRLDLLLLGIGADGHTASLFPGGDELRAAQKVASARAPAAPHERLTVTPSVIESARRIVVLASGGSKARSVARALTGPWDPASCPAQLARRGTWLLDAAAASALPPAALESSVA